MYDNTKIPLVNCKDIIFSKEQFGKLKPGLKKQGISYTNITFSKPWTISEDSTHYFGTVSGTGDLVGVSHNLEFKIRILKSSLRSKPTNSNSGNIMIASHKEQPIMIESLFTDSTTGEDITGSMTFDIGDLDNSVTDGGLFGDRWEGVKPTAHTSFVSAKENPNSNSGTDDTTGKYYRLQGGWYSGYEQTDGTGKDLTTWRHDMTTGWNELISYKMHNTTAHPDYFFSFDVGSIKPDATHYKINKCQQEINIHEGVSDCESCGCDNKVNTKVFRDVFEKEDGTKIYNQTWSWRDRNLIGMECDYIFNGDTVVNIHTVYPFVLKDSVRTDLTNIDICLRTCTDCDTCGKQTHFDYDTVIKHKLNVIKDTPCDPHKTIYDDCGKDITPKDCWKVEELLKYNTEFCGTKKTQKRWCLGCLRKIKQLINNVDVSSLTLDKKIRELVPCFKGNYDSFGDKTLSQLINEVDTKMKTKQDKNCKLTYLSTVPQEIIKKIK